MLMCAFGDNVCDIAQAADPPASEDTRRDPTCGKYNTEKRDNPDSGSHYYRAPSSKDLYAKICRKETKRGNQRQHINVMSRSLQKHARQGENDPSKHNQRGRAPLRVKYSRDTKGHRYKSQTQGQERREMLNELNHQAIAKTQAMVG